MRCTLVLLGAGLALSSAAACSDDPLARVQGSLRTKVLNVPEDTVSIAVEVKITADTEKTEATAEAARPDTIVLIEGLAPGIYEARVLGRDGAGVAIRGVWVSDILITDSKITEIVVDLGGAPPLPVPSEICNGLDDDGDGMTDELENLPLCTECRDGFEQAKADDERCGTIDCDGRDRYELRGENLVTNATKICVHVDFADITSMRCADRGRCIDANGDRCTSMEAVLLEAGLCKTIAGCDTGMPAAVVAPDGTPCAPDKVCRAGDCVMEMMPVAEVGCADGAREGFMTLSDYPSIAACAGAWTVGGVTRQNLAPACGRAAGNTGTNPEGMGCSAADLCAAGWHVCRGKDEVAQKAPRGCGDAVPPGAPDKSHFFAVAQNSTQNTTCDATGADNDVFGCGNLGTVLGMEKNCAPLNRALASTRADSCGFNEAEPPLGPWQCVGGMDSHFHEGAVVTKKGCPNRSCMYDGQPLGSADKGGVLCCRD